ncbi:MAG: EamA family transporter [Castellaniella sp.]|uniref:EamA family transporter n=1 Tax=Castellaniella sp. TaxID=1955812 RepID=UPI003A88B9E2
MAILLCVGSLFAANHVAARLAFDDQAGLLLAIVCRSGLTLLALAGFVLWRQPRLRLSPGVLKWQIVLGLLIALQSLCLYSAVARIPVALALLIGNTFPILLALLTWALGGLPPTRRACLLMGLILCGLILVLDLPAWLSASASMPTDWKAGIGFAFMAACVFSCGLWITEHRLSALPGAVRSLYTILIVFCGMLVAGAAGVVSGGMDMPAGSQGWVALAALSVLYATAFTGLFVFVPRLDMARNAPVMNIEPVASLLFGWLMLDQVFSGLQLLGGAVVLSGIVLLAYSRRR